MGRLVEILEITDEMAVQIISSDVQQYLYVERYCGDETIELGGSGNYKTATMLSEAFRDMVGYGPAVDILTKHGVPETDPLMTLGRKG